MKKKLALLLCAAMVLGTTACGSTNSEASASAETENESSQTTESQSGLGYADYEASDEYVAATEAAVYEGTDEWPTVVWNFDCSTGDTSTWAQAGYYFNALMQESTGGKVSVSVYAGEQLTNGDQVAGIQALIDGNPIQVSLHSNLIYANFDPRFNVVSLPYAFENYDDVDAVLGGEGGEALKSVLSEYGLVCEGIAENGFRQITNSKQPITSLSDLSSLKLRICSNDLCAEIYKEWGCDASVMNWSETYTALQQGTVDGQENPVTAIDSASVQDVQTYISMWNAYYDCLFFCINQSAYDQFTDSQKAVIDANAAKAVEYQKAINRKNVEEIIEKWTASGDLEVTAYEDIDSASFKDASAGVKDWYIEQLVSTKGMTQEDAASFVGLFE
ncbi:MAG: DctP family TRAP transporter solute-binding subunit [Butyrivibrio sp.]|nr:DctP family TRAP transporter solute-binding subunit [Butyrivibrio sp.]